VAIVVATTGTTLVAMARAMTDRPWARLLKAAAPVVLGLAALGCTDDGASGVDSLAPLVTAGAPPSTATAPLAPTTAPPAPGSTAPPAAAPPTTVAPPVDGAAVLSAAVAAMAPGYHYRSTVTVDGVVAVEADGDRVGDGTRLGVTRDGTSVQYVITPDGTWVMTDGGEWDQLDTPAATSDPIGALAAPMAVSVLSSSPEVIAMVVTVPNSALGLPGDGTADLNVTVTNGMVTAVAYRTAVDGRDAAVETALGPVTDPSAVVPPI